MSDFFSEQFDQLCRLNSNEEECSTVQEAFEEACKNGEDQLAVQLLEQGANPGDCITIVPNIRNICRFGMERTFQALMQRSENNCYEFASLEDEEGCNLMHWTASSGSLSFLHLVCNDSVLRALLYRSARITPLHAAARANATPVIPLLLANGVDVLVESHQGRTAAEEAMLSGSLEASLLLLPDANASTRCIRVKLLHVSAELGAVEVCAGLLSAEPSIVDETLKTRFGDRVTALEVAASNGQTEICALLLYFGANIEGSDPSYPPAIQALFRNHEGTGIYLLNQGACTNGLAELLPGAEKRGMTALLQWAASHGIGSDASSGAFA